MYPAPFRYERAATYEEAVALLVEHGTDARLLAGGQSLIPMMHLRLVRPAVLVDINAVEQKATPSRSNGVLHVPAMTRQSDLERSPIVRSTAALVSEAATHIGNIRVRNRGTVGGTLAHADPSSELSAALLALGAQVELRGPDGSRTLAVRDLFVTHFTTALAPSEIITSVRIPARHRAGHAFLELSRRAGEFAVVAVAAVLEVDERSEMCSDAALACAGVSDTVMDATDAARRVLIGSAPSEEVFTEVAEIVSATCNPLDDVQASAAYRRKMVGVFVRRALAVAAERAKTAVSNGG